MRKELTLVAAFGLIGLAVPRADALIDYSTGGNVSSIPGLTGFATTGAMMDGLAVTATFEEGVETVYWADTGATSGGVTGVLGTGWSLSLDGDTFSASWVFDQNPGGRPLSLLSLLLDGTRRPDGLRPDPSELRHRRLGAGARLDLRHWQL